MATKVSQSFYNVQCKNKFSAFISDSESEINGNFSSIRTQTDTKKSTTKDVSDKSLNNEIIKDILNKSNNVQTLNSKRRPFKDSVHNNSTQTLKNIQSNRINNKKEQKSNNDNKDFFDEDNQVKNNSNAIISAINHDDPASTLKRDIQDRKIQNSKQLILNYDDYKKIQESKRVNIINLKNEKIQTKNTTQHDNKQETHTQDLEKDFEKYVKINDRLSQFQSVNNDSVNNALLPSENIEASTHNVDEPGLKKKAVNVYEYIYNEGGKVKFYGDRFFSKGNRGRRNNKSSDSTRSRITLKDKQPNGTNRNIITPDIEDEMAFPRLS